MRIRPALLAAIALASIARSQPIRAQSLGPDVIVGDVAGDGDDDVWRFAESGGITAYAFRTESCNIGNMEAAWYSSSNQHPVIGQNMFRLMNGRFEQIGQAWVKHGFATENSSLCGACQPTGGDTLGVGCSDAYSALLNGIQTRLGPKSQVNACTGYFPYPFSAPSPPPGIGRRLQVHNSDLEAVLNPGALYFLEAQYVTQDDSFWRNTTNNCSWRQIVVSPTAPFEAMQVGLTRRMVPAIFAWVAYDPFVQIAPLVVNDDGAAGFNGYFWVAGRATYLGGCSWRYEYAVQNVNSFQACGTFSVDLPSGLTLTNVGFHDVDYHSGEPYAGTNWSATIAANSITWATQPFAQNANANAIRWGTLYNFRFEADAPPTCYGDVSVGLFRTPAISLSTSIVTPRAGSPCFRSGDIDADCDVDGKDFGSFLEAYGYCQEDDLYSTESDMDDDGCIDLVDYQLWLSRYRDYVENPQAPPPEPIYPAPRGDMNADGAINSFDAPIFVDVLLGLIADPDEIARADIDRDGSVDGRDIRPFIAAVLSGGS